ncbi:MAG: UvrD-helicase domain-containing protein [Christensenellales bacterium]
MSYYQNRFRYVHVDEYQDTNRAQYLLVRAIAAHGNICVVGDDDNPSTAGARGYPQYLDFERIFRRKAHSFENTAHTDFASSQCRISHNAAGAKRCLLPAKAGNPFS